MEFYLEHSVNYNFFCFRAYNLGIFIILTESKEGHRQHMGEPGPDGSSGLSHGALPTKNTRRPLGLGL